MERSQYIRIDKYGNASETFMNGGVRVWVKVNKDDLDIAVNVDKPAYALEYIVRLLEGMTKDWSKDLKKYQQQKMNALSNMDLKTLKELNSIKQLMTYFPETAEDLNRVLPRIKKVADWFERAHEDDEKFISEYAQKLKELIREREKEKDE